MTGLAAFLTGYPAPAETEVLHWPEGQLTLGELKTAARLAGALGDVAGHPVACVVDGGASALTAMFATWLAGGVYLPVSARLPDPELAAYLRQPRPAVVISPAGHQARVPAGLPCLIEREPRQWTAAGPAASPRGEPLPPGTAIVMRTSGTTGAAKPVLLRHAGVREGIDTVITRLRGRAPAAPGPPMPNLIPVSMALWAGLWNALFAFRVGAPAVLLDRFDPVPFALVVQRFSIRSTILAPAMMTMLCDAPDVTSLAPLKYVRSITAPLTPGQARRFRDRFGVQVLNCYGQTELGGEVVGWTAADLRDFGDRKLGAVGRPHAGVTVRVLGDDAGELPAGQTGELWIRSPFAASQAGPADGFLRTGDLGRLDDDGFLWIEGRTSDVINRGGLKVLPQEVEEVLRRHPRIADACVAGVPDERLGEVPVAWVRPLPGAPPDEAALRAFVRQSLAAYKVPVAVRLVGDFPRNEIGKVLRRELAAGWEAR